MRAISRFGALRNGIPSTTMCLLLVVAARGLLSFILIRHGIRALSDDDYSRVVIAQLFVEQPAFDPSNTSWLPFPFWLYGTCMACFGGSLAVAQAIGFVVGLCSTALLWVAARLLGLSRAASTFGTLMALAIPYSAWLGLATTPDVYSAALVLFTCATLARAQVSLRLLGALALAIASLSRYEAWPVAIFWTAFNAMDAARSRSWRYVWLALVGLVPPAVWMWHGASAHGSALFFVERVASYQRALGAAQSNAATRLISTPWRLVADASEIWALLLVAWFQGGPRLWRKRWTRSVCAMSGAVLLVWLGDWRSSTATHHASRTLLAPWFMLAMLTAACLWSRSRRLNGWHRARFALFALGALATTMLFLRPRISSTEPPQNRNEEVQFGLLASARLPRGARLAIATPGYGYFAVQAAFARPGAARIVNRHDPRRPSEDPLRSSSAARSTLANLEADWVIADRSHEQVVSGLATVFERGPSLFIAKTR
jgi:hypothetical protein